MPLTRVVPLFVYRTVPVVINADDRGMPTAFGGRSDRLGAQGWGPDELDRSACVGTGECPAGRRVRGGGLGVGIRATRSPAAGTAVADVPLAQGPAALLGHVLGGDGTRPRDLRIAAGAG